MKKRNLKLNDLIELWYSEGEFSRKPSTNEKYRRIIENHIKNSIGETQLSVLSADMVNRYISQLSTSGKNNGSAFAVSYVRTIAFVIKSALRYGINNRLCRSFYADIKLPGMPKSNVSILSVDNSICLTRYILSEINDKKLGVLLSLHLGLRIGEVCALKWSDIDFDNRTVHIQRNILRISTGSEGTHSVLSAGKVKSYSSDRVIPLPDYLFDLLVSFDTENEYIIKGKKYPFIDPRTLRNALDLYCFECNIPKIKFHALRHTFATRCIEFGMDVKTLSELLGHSNVNITLDLYVHSTLDHKRHQLESVSKFYLENSL